MKTLKPLFQLILVSLIIFSCSSDDDSSDNSNNAFNGSIESIENFFNPGVIAAFNELGFTINTGNNPPQIFEGSYLASPFILENTSVQGDNIGNQFSDYFFQFSNQNNTNLTIDFFGSGGSQQDTGFGSFISGNNSQFSVFLKITSTVSGQTADFAYALSGEVTDDGIENFEFVNLMLDDNGDPADIWIENNTGRLLVDADGFSPLQ